VQEVCAAYPRIGELEGLEQPRGWLLRAFRLFVDLLALHERKNVRAIDENEDRERSGAYRRGGTRADRCESSAWRHMNSEQRLLLVFCDVEGYSLAEIR
jgi:DNA-directed RNA polymerase specialized sigma24 family protein